MADEIKLSEQAVKLAAWPHLAEELHNPSENHRLRLHGPVGEGEKAFVISLYDYPRTVVLADSEAEALAAFKQYNGIGSTIHPIGVSEVE